MSGQRQFPAAPPAPSTPLVPVPSHAAAPPQSLLTRSQKFIEENQKLLLIGAAVAVSAGAGYYLYNRTAPGGPSAGGKEIGGGAKSSKKKNKKKKGGDKDKFVKGDGLEGPLLEEIEQKEVKAAETAPEVNAAPAGPEHLEGESVELALPSEKYERVSDRQVFLMPRVWKAFRKR